VRRERVDVCVRQDNPAEGVAGPDMGTKKSKTYLWPSEVFALLSSNRVPIRWRRLFALAIYTYMRAGELAALEWSDVDLEHGIIHVHRSIDRVRGRAAGSTKGDAARRIPIEPTLRPLLEALYLEARARLPARKAPTGPRHPDAQRRRPVPQAAALPPPRWRRPARPVRQRRDPQGDHVPRLAGDRDHLVRRARR
jgi:integrase